MGEYSCESTGSCMYKEWMSLQEQELSVLLKKSSNLNKKPEDAAACASSSDDEMASLLEKITQNFLDYNDRRRHLARRDVSSFLAPNWCTTFENSISWIGGCRPSSFFRLSYALCGSEIEAKLEQFLTDGSSSNFPKFSASQLSSMDDLQRRTIAEEEKLTRKVADLQQEMADTPLALMTRKLEPNQINLSAEVKDEIQEQALEYIISAKKLRLCVQAWGVHKDEERENGKKSPIFVIGN